MEPVEQVLTQETRKVFRAGDAVTAADINKTTYTAMKAYEAAANVLASIVPVQWQNGMLSVDSDGNLQLNQINGVQPGFGLNENTGELIMRLGE